MASPATGPLSPTLYGRLRPVFLDSLDPAQQARARGPYEDPERTTWSYIPGERPGVRVSELAPRQRELASALLVTSYSSRGLADAERVIRLEAIRRGLPGAAGSTGMPELSGQHYWLRLLGEAADPAWAWRLSGHHLVAQATVGDEVWLTPQFFGAEPARVPDGPYAGLRALPAEEDLARQLVGCSTRTSAASRCSRYGCPPTSGAGTTR